MGRAENEVLSQAGQPPVAGARRAFPEGDNVAPPAPWPPANDNRAPRRVFGSAVLAAMLLAAAGTAALLTL